METSKTDDTAARVVAWHNRHPLARRITPAQVDSIGLVSLPFAPTGKKPQPKPVFNEDFAPPLSRWRIRRFALKHAVNDRPGPASWPVRDIDATARQARDAGETPLERRYLVTASVEAGGKRHRLLLSPEPYGPVIGPHAWAPMRLAAGGGAALLPMLAIGLGLWLMWHPLGSPGADGVAQAASAAHAASAAAAAGSATHATAVAHAAASAATPPAHAAPAAGEADEASHAAHGADDTPQASAVAASASVAAAEDPAGPVDIRPVISEAAREAGRRELAAAQAAKSGVAASSPAAASPAPTYYALAAPALADRTRAQAQVSRLRVALASLPTPTEAQVQLFQVKGQWQAVGWPFVDRETADAASRALAEQGLQVSVLAF